MIIGFSICFFFFFKQKTAYEMRISDWSSDVCSSDLGAPHARFRTAPVRRRARPRTWRRARYGAARHAPVRGSGRRLPDRTAVTEGSSDDLSSRSSAGTGHRSEEHTSELQSLMRTSYAVFCLKKKRKTHHRTPVTNAPHKCSLLLETQQKRQGHTDYIIT